VAHCFCATAANWQAGAVFQESEPMRRTDTAQLCLDHIITSITRNATMSGAQTATAANKMGTHKRDSDIQSLNDKFRQTGQGGITVMSMGVKGETALQTNDPFHKSNA